MSGESFSGEKGNPEVFKLDLVDKLTNASNHLDNLKNTNPREYMRQLENAKPLEEENTSDDDGFNIKKVKELYDEYLASLNKNGGRKKRSKKNSAKKNSAKKRGKKRTYKRR